MEGTTDRARLPRVVCVTNQVRGWSHEVNVDELAAALAGRYEVELVVKEQVTADLLEAADVVVPKDIGVLHPVTEFADLWEPVRDKVLFWLSSELPVDPRGRTAHLTVLRRFAAAVVVSSRLLVEALEPFVPHPILYAPRGVDLDLFTPGPPTSTPPGELVVGWVGSSDNMGSTWRGLHLLEAAVARVDGARLLLQTREDERLPHDRMAEFYRQLDVIVCASWSEGGPGPPAEAAACGVPAVSTRVGSMPEFIFQRATGLLVERTVDELAAALIELRDDPDRRRAMGRMARRRAEQWSTARVAERFAMAVDLVLDPAFRRG